MPVFQVFSSKGHIFTCSYVTSKWQAVIEIDKSHFVSCQSQRSIAVEFGINTDEWHNCPPQLTGTRRIETELWSPREDVGAVAQLRIHSATKHHQLQGWVEPGQRQKGNPAFGSHPLLAQHDAQEQHCACRTDEDAAHSHPCVGFLNTRSCELPPPSYHAAQLSYSERLLSAHGPHPLHEPYITMPYRFPAPAGWKSPSYSGLTSPCSVWAYLQTATGTLEQTVHGKALLSPVLWSQNIKQSLATTVTNRYLMFPKAWTSLTWSSISRTL